METKNNNQQDMQELENLRQQVSEFKQRMGQQQIINDRLFRRSMTSNVSWLKHTNGWMSVIAILLMPLMVLAFRYGVGMQWAPIVVLCIVIVLEAIFNFWQIRSISASMFATSDLLTVRSKMLAFKRREILQMVIEVPLLILWCIWAFMTAECTNPVGMSPLVPAVGFGIGLIIALSIFFFEMRTLNKTLRELEDFTSAQE